MNTVPVLSLLLALSVACSACQAQHSVDTTLVRRLAEYIRSHYQTPEDYVVSKFKEHDIVFLGEWHCIKHDPELVQALIPRLPEAGVYFLAIEFARRVDQPLVDSLLKAPEYDERLAALILFKHYVFWGYQEYADIFEAAWRFNHSLPKGARKLRILALNNAPDWSHLRSEKDRDRPRVMTKVWHGETEKDWADVLVKEVLAGGDKALVYCGRHHAFTEYRQPRVARGKFYGFGDMRVGNYIFEKIGKRAITICLHAPWFSAEGYDKPLVLAADGYIDAVLAVLEPSYQRVGFDIAGTPFGELPGETSVYKHGYRAFKLKMIYDGYICQGPLASYKGVTPIPGFVNESNLHEAQMQSPSPQFRKAKVEDFMSAIAEAADIPRQLSGLSGALRMEQRN